jgi:Protein of unknown function, DUF547
MKWYKLWIISCWCMIGATLVFSQPNFRSLDSLLKKYVSDAGVVNYKALVGQKTTLHRIANELVENPPEAGSPANERLAYWINLYNVHTLKVIVDNYPLKSIKDLENGKIWDVKNIKAGSKSLSLNDIENGIIRKDFADARIHFALNCGAKSCPRLLNRAYVGSKLNTQLTQQTKEFVRLASENSLTSSKLTLSRIFDWYGKDFGDVIAFVNQYGGVKVDKNAVIQFKEYDWSLNGK